MSFYSLPGWVISLALFTLAVVGIAAVFADESPRWKTLSTGMFTVLRAMLVVIAVLIAPRDQGYWAEVGFEFPYWGPPALLYLLAVAPPVWRRAT